MMNVSCAELVTIEDVGGECIDLEHHPTLSKARRLFEFVRVGFSVEVYAQIYTVIGTTFDLNPN